MPDAPAANQIILAALPQGEDRISIANILRHSNCQLQFTRTLEETVTALRAGPVALVLCEGRLSEGHCWKDILSEMQAMLNAPPLIVVDRLADEALWAEVLNLGGYDLLAKPFNIREVLHAVTTACHFSADQRNRTGVHRKPPKSAACECGSGGESTPHLTADNAGY